MMVQFYYRTDNEAIVGGKKLDYEESLALEQRARAFADLFGAIPVFTKGLSPHFAGVTFNKQHGRVPQNWKLWTPPQNGAWVMWLYPPKSVPKSLKAMSAHWNKVWTDNIAAVANDMKPRSSHLLAAIGLNEEVIQGNALNYFFDPDGVSWIASTMPLDESKFTEVLASEYDKAREANEHRAAIAQAEQQAAAAAAAGVPTLTSIPYKEPAA